MKRMAFGILFAFLFIGSLAVMCGAESAIKADTVSLCKGVAWMTVGLLMLALSYFFGRAV